MQIQVRIRASLNFLVYIEHQMGNLSDFNHEMIVGAIKVALKIPVTGDDDLYFSSPLISRVYSKSCTKENHPGKCSSINS